MSKCWVCKRKVSAKGIFLFLLLDGEEVWVCGPKCAEKYDDDETGAYDVKGNIREARRHILHEEQWPSGSADTMGGKT